MPDLQSAANPEVKDEVIPADSPGQEDHPVEVTGGEKRPEISNHLGFAILALFCFPITAIIAVWYAAKVGDYVGAGEYDKARSASRTVKLLSKVSLIIAPIWIIAVIVISIIRSRLAGT